MEMFSFILRGNYKRFYEELKVIGKQTNKNVFLMLVDAFFTALFLGMGLSDYLNYRLYEKSFKEKKEYVSTRTQSKFYKKFSPREYAECFYFKPKFHEVFKDYVKRDHYVPVFGLNLLEEFINKHKEFVVKPYDGVGGHLVSKESFDKFETINNLQDYLITNRLFLEEVIVQNKEWGVISPTSVNTIRVMTKNINGTPEIFFMVARIGSGKSIADNFHQGGCGVTVDFEKGVLVGNGISKALEENVYHPLTNVKFDGYKIPYFNEIKEMVLKAALVNPKIMVVGWDVAIKEDGPCIIEGNRRPGYDLIQVTSLRGRMDLIRKMEEEYKRNNI
jgi:hypothetical protein